MRGLFIGLAVSVAFITGCLVGTLRLAVSPAQASHPVEQRWAYFCFQEASIDDINYKANAAGARGWELTSAASTKNGTETVWCFRQPRP